MADALHRLLRDEIGQRTEPTQAPRLASFYEPDLALDDLLRIAKRAGVAVWFVDGAWCLALPLRVVMASSPRLVVAQLVEGS